MSKAMKLVKHPTYDDIYYIQWNDGKISEDFINVTRAKEYIRQEMNRIASINATMPLRASEKPVGAFK